MDAVDDGDGGGEEGDEGNDEGGGEGELSSLTCPVSDYR